MTEKYFPYFCQLSLCYYFFASISFSLTASLTSFPPSYLFLLHLHSSFKIHPTNFELLHRQRLPTFHGVFEEEIIHIEDSRTVRVLGALDANSLYQVVYHLVHVIGEDRDVTRAHDELPEHAAHLQPLLSLSGKNRKWKTR